MSDEPEAKQAPRTNSRFSLPCSGREPCPTGTLPRTRHGSCRFQRQPPCASRRPRREPLHRTVFEPSSRPGVDSLLSQTGKPDCHSRRLRGDPLHLIVMPKSPHPEIPSWTMSPSIGMTTRTDLPDSLSLGICSGPLSAYRPAKFLRRAW